VRLPGYQSARAGELVVTQKQATVPFTFNLAMTTSVRLQGPLAGAINLLGPPW
jgi:hypothetical protein